jgi:hypothetical protein
VEAAQLERPATAAGPALTGRQEELAAALVEALQVAVPETQLLSTAVASADRAYHRVAIVLVALREEFRTPEGLPDLNGRTHGYRTTVREAYRRAGAQVNGPIEKRLTAGVSYWVRKILLERYGERGLYELGVMKPGNVVREAADWRRWRLPEDPEERLLTVVGLLNELATDSSVIPTEDLLRSVIRAARLLAGRLGPALTPGEHNQRRSK